MKILVTGCAGFIGVNFTKYWLDKYANDVVVGVDCLTYAANPIALEELKTYGKFKFNKANICNGQAMEEIFRIESPDIVINFAAETHVDRSIVDSRVFVETNVLGVQELLNLCLKYGVGRFHQISTDEVYGDLPLDSENTFAEDSPINPSSPYSASKAAADMLSLSYFKTHGLSVTVSRCANNYGKYQHTEKLIPKTITGALRDSSIPIYGNGLNVREWIHVYDHCSAVDAIVHNAPSGSVYNVGSGTLFSNIALVKEILSLVGKPESLITFVTDRKGHDRKYAMDCEKLKAELNWRAQTDFATGLREAIVWYEANLKNE